MYLIAVARLDSIILIFGAIFKLDLWFFIVDVESICEWKKILIYYCHTQITSKEENNGIKMKQLMEQNATTVNDLLRGFFFLCMTVDKIDK